MSVKLCNKILILGNGASGKTSLSGRLSLLMDINVLHLDVIYWVKGYQRADSNSFSLQVQSVLQQKSWIIEGTPLLGLDQRLEDADTIIFLDVNRYTCLFRALLRSFKHMLKINIQIDGCPAATFSWKTIRWIWKFNHTYRHYLLAKIHSAAASEKYIIKNKKAMETMQNAVTERYRQHV